MKNILNKDSYPNYIYWLLLLFICLISWWPVSFHVFSLKNDALNYFLPVRYQISEAISNGYWPFWSPYFNLGYPLHGDMQSGVWNPFVQLFSLFGPYTLRTLELETILYVFLSGISMFELVSFFNIDKRISLLIATSYMLCGFNSDSTQFLNWISVSSFLPAVFLLYYRMLTENSWKYSVLFGFILYLFFSTAYPADFIILIYLLTAFFVWHLFQKKGYKSIGDFFPFVKLHMAAIICFILLSSPAILSYIQFLPLTERGSGASYEAAMSNPYHPLLLFSFATPLGVWKAPYVGVTDPLERNSYIGIITFTVLILGFIVPHKKKLIRFCIWSLVICLIFSLGEIGLIRPISYYLLPLMDTFRHPANAKIFTIFFACLISGFTINDNGLASSLKQRRAAWYLVFALITIIAIWATTGKSSLLEFISFFKNATYSGQQLKSALDLLTFSDLLYINIIIQLPFLIIAYKYFVKKINIEVLLTAGVINCIIHTMMFMPFTAVKKDSAVAIQHLLDSIQTKGYPLPDYKKSLEANSYGTESLMAEIGTLNMYNKNIGRAEYRITPSNLYAQNEFWHNKKIRSAAMDYPLLYRADTAIHLSDTTNLIIRNKKAIVWIADSSIIQLINSSKGSNYDLQTKKFNPNEWEIEIYSKEPGYYCLFQNFYPNWQLYIDGEKTQIERCNISFMGFTLDRGKHVINFRYEVPLIKLFFSISLLLTLAILFLIIKWRFN